MPKKNTLLVVGAGLFQTFCILEAKKQQVQVLSIDKNPQAEGLVHCDDFEIASTKNPDECLLAAKKLFKKHKFNGVMTCGTDAAHAVALIADHFKLPGIPPSTAYNVTHKGLMRTVLKRHKVPVPDFDCADTLNGALKIFEKFNKPLVIKPVDSMGARGVRRICSRQELIFFMNQSISHSSAGKVILEEYMKGPEFSVETLVYDGQIHLISIADRHINGLPYFIERGHSLPSRYPKSIQNELFAMAKKGIQAMNITWGPVKFDMKYTEKGARIGEMTARLSGGFHSQMTERLSQGTNSIKAVMDISLGLPLDINDITPKFKQTATERSIYPRPGKVVSISGLSRAKAIPGVEFIHLNIRKGDIQMPVISNLGKAGHVICFGSTRRKALEANNLALKSLEIKTQ